MTGPLFDDKKLLELAPRQHFENQMYECLHALASELKTLSHAVSELSNSNKIETSRLTTAIEALKSSVVPVNVLYLSVMAVFFGFLGGAAVTQLMNFFEKFIVK